MTGKPEAKAQIWALGTFSAIVWAAVFVCFLENLTPPWWTSPVILLGSWMVAARVAKQVLKEERAKANEYRS